MNNQKVNGYTLCAWIFSAVSAPLAMAAAGSSWLTTVAAGLMCGVLCWCIHAFSDGRCWEQKWACILQFAWTAIAAGVIARCSADCWPMSRTESAVPLVLLALAAWGARDGAERASRVGGILFWLLAGLYAIMLGAGIKDAQPKWMLPDWAGESEKLIFILLIPTTAAVIPRENRGVLWVTLLGIAGFGAALSLIVMSTISPLVAMEVSNPLYEYSRSLSLFGVAKRFEAFVSAALTMGFYCALSLLLCSAMQLAERIRKGEGRRGLYLCALVAALIVVIKIRIPQLWLAISAIGIWAGLPVIMQGVQTAKNAKKTENNA